ncbi:MAG TPA: aminoglycoside 6-adenylyltransferase [Roseiflexaceae bacterium]|nr:aminoglycoside 6-adenylyltransferase [Roseiflexaceae bacterium]
MDSQAIQLAHNHQVFVDRFVAACEEDKQIMAAFLGGSYVKGAADAYSDLDLCLITTDAAYEDFLARRKDFLRLLGEPVFLEDFDLANIVFFIFNDGTEGELWFGSQSHLDHIHSGPYWILLDKQRILAGAVFPEPIRTEAEQIETLRRLVYWFWHDMSHFITAIGRGQLWWAYSQLEELRRYCLNLARLHHNFSDADVGSDGYFKVERAIPIEQLSPLQGAHCPMERGSMLQAALVIIRFYQQVAPDLARGHGIAYPDGLERVMKDRLEQLWDTRLG